MGDAPPPATGGEDLSSFIAEADGLRILLGFARWSDLAPLCDGADPKDLDRRGLVKLIGDLGAMYRYRKGAGLDVD